MVQGGLLPAGSGRRRLRQLLNLSDENSVPYSDQPPGATPDNTCVGNFYQYDYQANGYDDGFAVTGSQYSSAGQNYLTDVGAYTSSPSFYGTFDQGGNVREWTERQHGGFGAFARDVRGGSWQDDATHMWAGGFTDYGILEQPGDRGLGFRVATIVPEPCTLLLTIMAFATLLIRRR
jgi:sulfatase modifying factor 1